MALFCAAIRIDSVSRLKFSFRSHVQVFSCKISLFCRLKYSYNCFSSHFFFLVVVLLIIMLPVLFLATIISLSLLFKNLFFEFVLMHPPYLQCWGVPSLLLFVTRMVYLSSLGCLSSLLVHFKNGPEYLTKGTAQVFVPLTRFLQQRLVWRSFLVRLRYSLFKKNISSPLV